MIKSMTAYSRVEENVEKLKADVEIRSYNSRHLDILVKLPHGYLPIEDRIRELVSKKATRGRIEVKLWMKNESEGNDRFEIDTALAEAYHGTLVQLREMFHLTGDVPLDLLARTSGIIVPAENKRDIEAEWPLISGCVEKAMDGLNEMREREGDFLRRDFEDRLQFVEDSLRQIEAGAKDIPKMYQERLKERIAALIDGIAEPDPVRLAQEAAFLADKSDISEEIVRAQSHIGQFREIMNSDEPAGRKLNFLLQEFNREFNTVGSKAQSADIAHTVVAVKSELEKLREQVQNVE